MINIPCTEREPWLSHDPRVYLMYTARARELQSEAIGRAFRTAGRFLARTGSNAFRWFTGAIRKRQTIATLSRLDDHMLADIGIDRRQIPMIAQGLIGPSGAAPRRSIPAAPCPPALRGDAANDTKTPSVAA
ncbi:MAG: DUF1127 domain-containing protein [Gammaproteobacteria bacterium]|nr:DUF1127 domain-containing protein [Gammaproteobacteria bacterium]